MTYVGSVPVAGELQEFEESRLLMPMKALVHEYRAWCAGKGTGPAHCTPLGTLRLIGHDYTYATSSTQAGFGT